MPRSALPKAKLFVCILLFAASSCSRKQPATLRLAGDEWFLDSLTKTQMIADFEKQSGIHVEVLHKNDRTIMSDLDRGPTNSDPGLDIVVMRHRWLGALVQKSQVQPIDSLLADPTVHDASFVPQQQLFPNWWRELGSYENKTYGYPFTSLTTFLCYRKDLLGDPANQRNFRARYHRAQASRDVAGIFRTSRVLHPSERTVLRYLYSRETRSRTVVRVAESDLRVWRKHLRYSTWMGVRRHRDQLSRKCCCHDPVRQVDCLQSP